MEVGEAVVPARSGAQGSCRSVDSHRDLTGSGFQETLGSEESQVRNSVYSRLPFV